MKYNDTIGAIIIGILLTVIVVMSFNKCGDSKPVNQIDLKPELKAQDSLKGVVDSLDKTSKILQDKAYKLDSTAKFYVNKYRFYKAKFLSKQDSTPCGKEIIFLTQACDSVIAQDSIRDLAWKELHKNDSTEISSLKNLTRIQDIISIKKDTIIRQKSDSIKTLTRSLRRQKLKTKGVIALWLAREAVGIGIKVKN